MKIVTQEYFDNTIPYIYNIDKLKKTNAIDKNGNFNDNYIKILSMYKLLLEKMIKQEFNLKKYDDKLKNSPLDFKPIDKDNMDTYQYYSDMGLDYIYLRNTIDVSNLNTEEIKFITDKYNNNDFNIDEKTAKFINNTYIKVIRRADSDPYMKTYVCYHPDSNPNYSLEDSCIVLGIRYDEFYKDSDNEWTQDKYIEKEKYLYELINRINKDLYNKNVVMLRYNNYNVIFMDNDQVKKSR